jgi:putative oxidoreductase
MFEQASPGDSRNGFSDWMMRGAIALAFILFGADKLSAGWIALFQQIGIGQWFRYFTGAVEVLGGLFVLIPKTVSLGLAILCSTMASAALILAFIIHRPQDSVFSGALLIGLSIFWWNRRA